jgi:putative ABC transport system permease protein
MTALGKVVRAGVGRRRVQTTVLALTALIAVAASVLAAGLLVASNAPFDHGFATQHGAQLTAQFDGTKTTTAQLTATAHAAGVSAAAGPFPTVSASPRTVGSRLLPAGAELPPLTITGRADPGGPVDDVTLTHGHWATGPGQIVLASNTDLPPDVRQLQFPDAPGRPTLTVVGVAASVSQTADAWVTPTEIRALMPAGVAPGYQMLYRFSHAGTDAEIVADRAAIAATLPAGALTGTQSWLAVKQVQASNTAAFVPFVTAFGILALILSVLIISIVVSGAVGAATRRIGILKALGFTPAQVTRAYVAQAAIPAAAGVVLGAVLGNLLAVPVLHGADRSYGTAGLSIPMWVDIGVPAAALVAVAVAAMLPALRAGRLRAVDAIAVGRTPRAGRGRRAQRLTGRLPVPRPLGLGLANPFAHPARSAMTAATVVFGAVTVTFAVGLAISLSDVQSSRELDSAGAVVVDTGGPAIVGTGAIHAPGPGNQQPTTPADPRAVAAAIAGQPGTRSYYGITQAQLNVSGIAGRTNAIAYQGDSSWATHQMVSGHWLTGPGQAVATGRFLTAAGIHLGSALTLTDNGKSTSVQVVGEVFTLSDDGMDLLTSTPTFADLGLPAQPSEFHVDLRPGTSVSSYLDALNNTLQPTGAEARPNQSRQSDVIKAMDALIAMLTVMLVVVAGLGVLNTVVLDTRDRVHDLGVVKALGMTPRQTVAMVLTSVGAIGLLAGMVGVPIGVALHHYVLPIMAHTTGEHLPPMDVAVFHPTTLALLVLGGLLIAMAGALLPAGWAAKVRPATALRTE